MPEESTVYQRRSAPVQQLKFPSRRHLVRLRDDDNTSENKRQSTLTQIDFVSTPMTRREVCPDSSDDVDRIEDSQQEEYHPRPRKRQKRRATITPSTRTKLRLSSEKAHSEKAQSKKAQSTLTQRWDQFPSTSDARIIDDSDGEDESFERPDIEDAAPQGDVRWDVRSASKTPTTRSRAETLFVGHEAKPGPQNASHSESSKSTAAKRRNADAPTTPQKLQRIVPSSQTPASIKITSTYSPTLQDRYDRSPLSERHHNAVPLDISPHTPMTRRRPKDVAERSPEPVSSPLHKMTPSQRPRLKHMATVQDSQGDIDDLSSDVADVNEDEAQAPPASSNLSRMHTQQTRGNTQYQQTQYQQTYDPVAAALDRDAARFQLRTQATFSSSGVAASQTRALHAPQNHSQARSSQLSHEEEFVEANEYPADDEAFRTVPSSPDNLHGSPTPKTTSLSSLHSHAINKHPGGNEEFSIPDSPIHIASTPSGPSTAFPPRPSQVSTVVSSSPSPRKPSLTTIPTEPPSPSATDRPPLTMTASWPATCSSSPFPMPPWTAEQRAARAAAACMDNDSSELGDFSIPPPPPILPPLFDTDEQSQSR